MREALDRILKNPTVQTRPPCDLADLARLTAQISAPVPDGLAKFWRSSNGAIFSAHDAKILATHEVSELLHIDGFGTWLLDSGFLPFLYDEESNYIALAFKTPLEPRLIYVLHDDSPKVLYRNTESFFEGCNNLLLSADFAGLYFHMSDGDFGPDAVRTNNDLAAGKQLMQSAEDWHIAMAVQLLDATCTEEWNSLLNGDRFARQDALRRLRTMTSINAKNILASDAKAFDAFVAEVCGVLDGLGMRFEQKQGAVRINRHWMDLNAFFGRRHIKDAMPRLVDWFKDEEVGNMPTDRPGNYMADS